MPVRRYSLYKGKMQNTRTHRIVEMLGQATSERAGTVSRKCVEHYSVNIVQADRRAIIRSVRLGDRSIDFCTQAAEEISVRALARGRKQMKRAREGAPALQRIGSPAG